MRVRISALHRNKKMLIIGIVIAVIGILATVIIVSQTLHNNAQSTVPTYETVLPKSKSIESLGGWKVLRPPKNEPIYTYGDKIGNIGISVTQQVLDDEFKNNINDKVAQIAKDYNATTEVDVGNTKMYIGTSARGPQSVIVAKNDLLILIKSEQKISNDDWVAYLKTLQ